MVLVAYSEVCGIVFNFLYEILKSAVIIFFFFKFCKSLPFHLFLNFLIKFMVGWGIYYYLVLLNSSITFHSMGVQSVHRPSLEFGAAYSVCIIWCFINYITAKHNYMSLKLPVVIKFMKFIHVHLLGPNYLAFTAWICLKKIPPLVSFIFFYSDEQKQTLI